MSVFVIVDSGNLNFFIKSMIMAMCARRLGLLVVQCHGQFRRKTRRPLTLCSSDTLLKLAAGETVASPHQNAGQYIRVGSGLAERCLVSRHLGITEAETKGALAPNTLGSGCMT